jgi:hypothetical protein
MLGIAFFVSTMFLLLVMVLMNTGRRCRCKENFTGSAIDARSALTHARGPYGFEYD